MSYEDDVRAGEALIEAEMECLCRYEYEPDVGGGYLAAENPDCPIHGPMVF